MTGQTPVMTEQRRYLAGMGILADQTVDQNAFVRFFHRDLIGSTTQTSDETGALGAVTAVYTTFGEPVRVNSQGGDTINGSPPGEPDLPPAPCAGWGRRVRPRGNLGASWFPLDDRRQILLIAEGTSVSLAVKEYTLDVHGRIEHSGMGTCLVDSVNDHVACSDCGWGHLAFFLATG
ncbi:MAG: hypothetical protein IPM18_15085 [Phycisphaerales bacterium]|nr:hypothetical protein [Phycisphaerales bacterium]